LLVHRAIRHVLRTGKAGGYQYDSSAMERLGAICSAHERRAEEATREVEAWLKCQFMEDKVGQSFTGVITGVTNFGAFVQIPEMAIDGLVHVTNLRNDYYHFEPGSQALVGERSGQRYRLGDRLDVTVARVDLDTRRIDFSLADEPDDAKRRVGAAVRKGGKRR
jgi:ribonuclease R